MAWIIEALEIRLPDGTPSGRYRLTARSDEDGGGPFSDTTHDHGSRQEASDCEACDEFCARVSGFPSRKAWSEMRARDEREAFERLKTKFEGGRQ